MKFDRRLCCRASMDTVSSGVGISRRPVRGVDSIDEMMRVQCVVRSSMTSFMASLLAVDAFSASWCFRIDATSRVISTMRFSCIRHDILTKHQNCAQHHNKLVFF